MDSRLTATSGAAPPAPAPPLLRDRLGRAYEPAVGPRLKVLLFIIFACVAVLGATGVYLTSIRVLETARQETLRSQFSLWMLFIHVLVGIILLLPFFVFGFAHLATARKRKNRRAVKLGIGVFVSGIGVVLTGLALVQILERFQLPSGTVTRWVVYGLHVATPVLAVVLYILHRRAGPDIKWRWGYGWGASVGLFVVGIGVFHVKNPHLNKMGSVEGIQYFYPSESKTDDGNFIDAKVLTADSYCLKCHQDIYNDWYHSAHHFSSFNNPAYLFSVEETRKVALARDGNVKASRWCAGCHDPVPFFSGQFDDPNYDIRKHPTSQAGITCTVCHAITHVDSPVGNGAYTIKEPEHYPFAFSDNAVLQWINNQWIKANPDFHKQTFLKPLHQSTEFCSTCHKVSLPLALNHYKEWLRGQNHHDTFLLSGMGNGSRSFYFPPAAKQNCGACHMPLEPSLDFGTKDFDGSGVRKRHVHLFPAANNGLPWLLSLKEQFADQAEGFRKAAKAHEEFLKDKKLRIDLFGIKDGGSIDGQLHVLRPQLPTLKPGQKYLVEVVVRTLNIGHPFTQGTVDSNEVWVDLEARAGGKVIGRNGALAGPDDTGEVDPWSHFVNVLMLTNNGQRINRRNPQDIFTPLYDHQIPPGAAQVVHYSLEVPKDVSGPVELRVRLRYRKFDFEYMALVHGGADKVPKLPVVDICEDRVTLPVEGVAGDVKAQESPIQPAWQRWNDYGIGCYIEGGLGNKRGELRQAEEAFQQLLSLDGKAHWHGHVNLARVYIDEGRFREAEQALNLAGKDPEPAPWWLVRWFSGLINAQYGRLEEAARDFEEILDKDKQPRDGQGRQIFDFTKDYVVIVELARTLFRQAQQQEDQGPRDELLRKAVARYEEVLRIDPENLEAHFGLRQCFERLGEGVGEAAVPLPGETDLLDLANTFADPKQPKQERLAAAQRLRYGVPHLGQRALQPDKPKLPILLSLLGPCRKVFDDPDPELRQMAAFVLGNLYQQTHTIYKPDENARNETVQKYRARYPAADAAAEAIVIYPTERHRPDPQKPRPGFE